MHAFVAGQVRRTPSLVRLGTSAVELLLRLSCGPGPLHAERHRARVAAWARSAFPPARQYVRLLRSLVLFAGYEQIEDVAAL